MTSQQPTDEPRLAPSPVRSGRASLTGRYLLLFNHGHGIPGAQRLRRTAGIRTARSSDFVGTTPPSSLRPGEGILFEALDVALLHADLDLAGALMNCNRGVFLSLAPERKVRATWSDSWPPVSTASDDTADLSTPLFADTKQATWGIQATRSLTSRFSGRGIRLAVLDSGIDAGHPDFTDREIVMRSFIADSTIEDTIGHGTYCTGIAGGPARPIGAPRYGVACDADLYVAKVLDDEASGIDGNILAALDWSIRNGCAVASLSLGTPVDRADPPSQLFEQVAERALAAGMLLFAAAGNNSQRPDELRPVEHPANCPSIVAVGAIGPSMAIAPFSGAGLNSCGGQVDLVAPGVGVTSAWVRPKRYEMSSGTSMAVPFAAGIAALLAEANPGVRGAALRDLLFRTALPLPYPARDVGAGFVIAPQ